MVSGGPGRTFVHQAAGGPPVHSLFRVLAGHGNISENSSAGGLQKKNRSEVPAGPTDNVPPVTAPGSTSGQLSSAGRELKGIKQCFVVSGSLAARLGSQRCWICGAAVSEHSDDIQALNIEEYTAQDDGIWARVSCRRRLTFKKRRPPASVAFMANSGHKRRAGWLWGARRQGRPRSPPRSPPDLRFVAPYADRPKRQGEREEVDTCRCGLRQSTEPDDPAAVQPVWPL